MQKLTVANAPVFWHSSLLKNQKNLKKRQTQVFPNASSFNKIMRISYRSSRTTSAASLSILLASCSGLNIRAWDRLRIQVRSNHQSQLQAPAQLIHNKKPKELKLMVRGKMYKLLTKQVQILMHLQKVEGEMNCWGKLIMDLKREHTCSQKTIVSPNFSPILNRRTVS